MNKQLNCFSGRRLTAWLSVVTILLALGRLGAQSPDAFNLPANGPVYAIAVQPDSQVLLGGAFTTLDKTTRNRLGRVSADGNLDPDFNPTVNGDVYAVALQPNGRILIAGSFTALGVPPFGSVSRTGLARLNADGTLDYAFDPKPSAGVYAVAQQADGKVLLGGSFTTLGDQTRRYLGRLHADGTLDLSFNPSANGSVTALAVQADGKILVGGSFTQLAGVARNYLGRLNPDGTLDATFNPAPSMAVTTLLVQPDAKILVGSTFTNLGGNAIQYLGRLDEFGRIDSAFNPQLNGSVQSLALQADGQILVGGSFTSVAAQPRGNLARLYADGSLDETFNPAANGTVYSLALQPDGQLLVGGAFTILAGQTRTRLGRLSNTAPATQSLLYENSTLTWVRGGTSPELGRLSFELTTNGTDWVGLGPVNHTVTGWQVTNLTLPANYAIRARGYSSGGQYNSSSWPVLDVLGDGPPVIADQPRSQRVSSGAPAGFRVVAVGTPPLTYQWHKNGQLIPNATDASYLLASSAPADAANYSVRVANPLGEVSSRAVTLAVLHPNMPFASTQPPGPVGQATATLHGMVTPRGSPTLAWFEWGTDASYGQCTTPTAVGSGTQVIRLSAPIEGLDCGAVYYYRLVASNAFSVTLGAGRRFTTGMRLASWGDYTQGYPSIPSGLTNLVEVASGHAHALALENDGTLVAWHTALGYSSYGQTNAPSYLSNVVAVAGGWVHSLALSQGGTVSAWGKYMSPSQAAYVPAGLSNVIAIAGGDSHSLALKSDGTVVAWGGNSMNQLQIPYRLSNVVAIAAGSTHSLALKADGTVVTWGSSMFGNQTPPTGLSNIVAITTESAHNLALRTDGSIVAWGDNSAGQLNVPADLDEVVAIAAGFRHSLGLKADGTLVAWGDPNYVTSMPASLAPVVAITSGDFHSQALTPVNLPPRPWGALVTGRTNSDLVISLSAWDPNGDWLSYRLTSPPTNGTLYQYTVSGRGQPINSPDTPVTDSLGRVIFSPLPDTFGAPYTTLSLIANDAEFDSLPGLLTINIVPPPAFQAAGWIQQTNRGFALSFAGLSNASYTVQVSTDLTNWTWAGYPTQTSAGQFFFLDSGATNQPKRFYRLRSP